VKIRIALALPMFAVALLAHHSSAMFDGTKLVVLKGTMLSFTNMNPHGWISVQAKVNGAGKSERWDIEATSPGQLAGIGIKSDTLKQGDKVTVGIRPLRDGRRAGSMVFVITSDAVVHGAKLSDLGLDLDSLKP
jgi:hypothetical protein